jgi:hypothetical protein
MIRWSVLLVFGCVFDLILLFFFNSLRSLYVDPLQKKAFLHCAVPNSLRRVALPIFVVSAPVAAVAVNFVRRRPPFSGLAVFDACVVPVYRVVSVVVLGCVLMKI